MPFLGRERIQADVRAHFKEVIESASNSLKARMFVIHGAPGTGKTRALYEILEAADDFKDTLVIGITFNSSTPVHIIEERELIHKCSLNSLISIRLCVTLSKMFGKNYRMDCVLLRVLDSLKSNRLPPYLLALSNMCSYILSLTKHKYLLLLVDDPLRLVANKDMKEKPLLDDQELRYFLSTTSSLQDDFLSREKKSRVCFVYTGLLSQIFRGCPTARLIRQVSLPHLSIQDAKVVLTKLVPAEKFDSLALVYSKTDSQVYQTALAALSGGHPRTLESIISALGSTQVLEMSAILDSVRQILDEYYEMNQVLYFVPVVLSLAGQRFHIDTSVAGRTLDSMIGAGLLFSEIDVWGFCQPRLLPLILEYWAFFAIQNPQNNKYCDLAHVIRAMFTRFPFEKGEGFELFFMSWEVAMRHVRSIMCQSMKIRAVSDQMDGSDVDMVPVRKDTPDFKNARITDIYQHCTKYPAIIWKGISGDALYDFTQILDIKPFENLSELTRCDAQTLKSHLWRPKSDQNQGFDFLVPVSNDNTFIFLAVENKWGKEHTTKKISARKHLIKKYNLTKDAWTKANLIQSFVFVLFSYKDVTKPNKKTQQDIPPNSIVVDKTTSNRLFGPTLEHILNIYQSPAPEPKN